MKHTELNIHLIHNKLSTHTIHTYFHVSLPQIMLSIMAVVVLASCSTGIESTKTIRMSKEDMKLMTKSDEQVLASEIKGTPLSQWETGKPFLAMSDRTLLIFEPSGLSFGQDSESIEGKTLRYQGVESRTTPDLTEECVILFSDGDRTYRYPTGKTTSEAMADIDSSKLPLVSDLALIEQWKDRISGMTLWTKSNLWYDSEGERRSGLRFAEVKVEDVLPASGEFPMKVKIVRPDGDTALMHMNYTADMADSRNFSALFFLKDPKIRYPQISDSNWSLIQSGKIGLGMTKEECRLSLGNPDDINAGHNTTHTMDIWQYTNGTYLMFTDGLLTRFRQ